MIRQLASLFPRPILIGLGLILLFSLIAFWPALFAGPGYESALIAGLFLPSLTAIVTALRIIALQPEPLAAIATGLRIGALFATFCYALSLLQGLRVGLCDPLSGSLHFLLGPITGSLLAGCCGAIAGHLASLIATPRRQRIACILLALFAPLASIAVSLYRFYTSPMVFAFDPFVGFFSGTLYDTVIEWTGLVSYRAGTLCTLLFFLCTSALLQRDPQKRLGLSLKPWKSRPELALSAAAFLLASLLFSAYGSIFGHYQSPKTIAESLGASYESQHCTVIYPSSIPKAQAQRFARECDAHIEQGARYFEIPVPFKITAYLFSDSAQKAFYMGAANTYVAKPWRREIYVQQHGFPHPVLGHEIMHVLSGAFARGPFNIAGSFYGILPDPGLIEGIAVAAAPREGDLSPAEWAKAMKDLGLLPQLKSLFALGFLGHNAALAYTVSGAFVEHIRSHYGASILRSWYGGENLSTLTGKSWEALEQEFHHELDRLSLSEAARAQAKARFDRPAIFGRRCPHVVDACKQRAEAYRAAGDFTRAMAEYDQARRLDTGDIRMELDRAETHLRMGRVEDAKALLNAVIANPQHPEALRDRASEELGDIALSTGDLIEAERHYTQARRSMMDEDALRTLDVKLYAIKNQEAKGPVVELLIGRPGEMPDKILAIEQLGSWAARDPGEGLPHYLLARHYMGAAQYGEAWKRIEKALSGRQASARVRAEALRMAVVTACALGEKEAMAKAFKEYQGQGDIPESRRLAVESFVKRCGGENLP